MKSESDDEILQLLKETLNSPRVPEITDETVDAFIALSNDCPSDALDRMRILSIQKIFSSAHPKPVRHIDTDWPFGRWLEVTRNSVHLSRMELAAALGKEPTFLEHVETGDVLPWNIKHSDIAELLYLIRLHIDGLIELIQNTASSQPQLIVPSMTYRPKHEISGARGQSTKSAQNASARNSEFAEIDQEISSWIESVRDNLKKRQARDLLE